MPLEIPSIWLPVPPWKVVADAEMVIDPAPSEAADSPECLLS